MLEMPTEEQLQQSSLSVTEQDMIALIERFVILQDQFNQLTKHVEKAFESINNLQVIVQSKILS